MNNNLFYCYSVKLYHFLSSMGIRYISIGVNKNTNKKYWTYEKSEKLDKVIEHYNKIKFLYI